MSQISQSYLDTVNAFDDIVLRFHKVSKACEGIRAPSSAHYYASLLFTTLCVRAYSLSALAPCSRFATPKEPQWDHASIGAIVRSILELRLAFFYLCTESCSPEEWKCRWNVFNLNDCTNRIHLFEEFQDPETGNDLKGFLETQEELRERLRNNSFFNSLEASKQRQLLNGQMLYFDSLEVIASRAGLEIQKFRILFRLLSSHVHGLPLSFYRIGENRGRGIHSEFEEQNCQFFIETATSFLEATADEMERLFDGLMKG